MRMSYSATSLSRLSKLSGSGSALRYLAPRAAANANFFLLASWFLEKFSTPKATGLTPYSAHSFLTAAILSGLLSTGTWPR